MEPTRVAFAELSPIIEQDGLPFGWSPSYQASPGISIRGLSATTRLKEPMASVSVAPIDLSAQYEAITAPYK